MKIYCGNRQEEEDEHKRMTNLTLLVNALFIELKVHRS